MLVVACTAGDHERDRRGNSKEADRRGSVVGRLFDDSRHDLIHNPVRRRLPSQRAAQIVIQVHDVSPFRSVSIDRRTWLFTVLIDIFSASAISDGSSSSW